MMITMFAIENTSQENLQEGWWQVWDCSSAHDTAAGSAAAQALQTLAGLQHITTFFTIHLD